MHHWFQHFLAQGHGETHAINTMVMGSSIVAGLGGILLAAVMYLWRPALAETVGKIFKPLYTASINKLWFDELYSFLIVRPFHKLGQILFRFDQSTVDGAVNGTGWLTLILSRIQFWLDQYLVDGLVNFTGALTQGLSAVIRKIQSGFIQNYMFIVFLGVLVLIYMELKP